MKPYTVLLLLVVALILSSAPVASTQVHHTRLERAVTRFDQPVSLSGVVLQGEYLFLHHSGLMEKHKPCIFVYTHEGDVQGKLILAFACQPIPRNRVEQFTVQLARDAVSGMPEIVEVQFAGSLQGHRVPPME